MLKTAVLGCRERNSWTGNRLKIKTADGFRSTSFYSRGSGAFIGRQLDARFLSFGQVLTRSTKLWRHSPGGVRLRNSNVSSSTAPDCLYGSWNSKQARTQYASSLPGIAGVRPARGIQFRCFADRRDAGQSFRLRCAFSALSLQPSAERYSEGVRRCEAHVRSVSQRGGL